MCNMCYLARTRGEIKQIDIPRAASVEGRDGEEGFREKGQGKVYSDGPEKSC